MSENGIGVVSNINNLLKDHNFESLESWEPHITNSTDMKISQRALSKALFGKKFCICVLLVKKLWVMV